MSDRELLKKHGWYEHSRKRMGCVVQVWWCKPGDKLATPQGHAAMILREQLRIQKAAPPAPSGESEVSHAREQ